MQRDPSDDEVAELQWLEDLFDFLFMTVWGLVRALLGGLAVILRLLFTGRP